MLICCHLIIRFGRGNAWCYYCVRSPANYKGMNMRFQNGKNGYIEEKTVPWFWTILFGGIYFLVNGLWAGFLIWFLIGAFLFASMGPAATLLMIVLGLIMSAFAPSLIRSSYLRRGWVQIDDNSGGQVVASDVPDAGNSQNSDFFNGVRDINSPKYQLFLIKRFSIEKNAVLEKYVVGDEIFGTLEDALESASRNYEKLYYASLDDSSGVITPSLPKINKNEEDKADNKEFAISAVVIIAVIVFAIFYSYKGRDRDVSNTTPAASISNENEAKGDDELVNRRMERIKQDCGASPDSMNLWMETHKTGWAEHAEQVAKCVRTHE